MVKETRTLVDVANYEPFMRLLLESSTNDVLVQALAERWWDTTYTFHIAKYEITMTPHDFHQMISLRSHRPIINLEGESGIQVGIDLLGLAYFSEHVRYYDLEVDFKPLS